MKIQKIIAHPISYELGTEFWMSREPYRTASSILVQVFTDEGIVGLGQVHGRPMKEIVEIIGVIEALIVGMDAMANDAVWQKIFNLPMSRAGPEIGSASCRDRACQYESISVVAVYLKKKHRPSLSSSETCQTTPPIFN